MALLQKIAHLSKLAFFVSLGVAATIMHACGDGEAQEDRDRPAGGAGSGAGAPGEGGTTSIHASSNGGATGLGGSREPASSEPKGGASATSKRATGPVADAGPPPKDAQLWDVICE